MEVVRDTAVVNGPPEAVWSVIEDPAALRRVLPGCEALDAEADGLLRGVLAARIQFLTVRADVTARLSDADRPRHVRLQLDGRPRAIAGSFSASIPVDLAPTAERRTRVNYSVDLAVTGRLATFGLPLLRQTLRDQVSRLVANLDRELVRRAPDGTA